MLVLSSLYEKYNDIPIIISPFSGLQVIVVAIVLDAAYSFGKGTFKNYQDIILAMDAAALLWAGISPFIVIIGASFAGIMDRLKNSIYFHGATKGILTSFVGLLFFVTIKVTIKFASAVPWDVMKVLLACVAFAALLKKIDIVYIVLIAALISVIIF